MFKNSTFISNRLSLAWPQGRALMSTRQELFGYLWAGRLFYSKMLRLGFGAPSYFGTLAASVLPVKRGK